jgi:MarR family transcriptional regulator, organic hydroperoxide resistance regulator
LSAEDPVVQAPAGQDPFAGSLGFVRLLWQLNHSLQAASKRMERDLGITSPQRLVVRALEASPGMTPGLLAQVLHLDPGTITGIVKRLLRAGLVRSGADPHDRRRLMLALTRKGRLLAARKADTIESRAEAALAGLSPRDAQAAERALAAVAAALLADAGPAPTRR